MKKIIILSILTISTMYANINAVVSILPQKTFLKAIGGDKVNISLMVKPGNSPHTYETKTISNEEYIKKQIFTFLLV